MLTFLLTSPVSQCILGKLGLVLHSSEVRLSTFTVKTMAGAHYISGQIDGSWKQVAQLEIHLTALADEHQGFLKIWRSQEENAPLGLPYQLEVTYLEDHSKTFSSLMQLLSEMKIKVNAVNVETTSLSDEEQFITKSLFQIFIPVNLNIQYVREQFYGLCESLSLDGTLELSHFA